MTWFAVLAALLVAVALSFLLLPLLRAHRRVSPSLRAANVSVYRDQFAELERDLRSGVLEEEQYAQAREELERRLLDDVQSSPQVRQKSGALSGRLGAAVLAVALPVGAGLLYMHLGNPQALHAPTHAGVDPASVTLEQFQQMTDKLAARMETNPGDAVGWTMLGRAYKALERYPDAARALARAEQLQPKDPEILVEYAEALALEAGGKLEGKPTQLLDRALKIAPDQEKALMLRGTAAFSHKDYAAAIRYWQRLSSKVPAETELGKALATGMAEARARASGKASPPDSAKSAAGSGKGVSGVIRLAPALAGKVAPEDTVFIFARAAEGPKMPLAVVKKQVKDLPFTFTLDDSMAMRPGMELSSYQRVIVAARVSKSGNAAPASGDLVGASQPVSPGAADVAVLIDNQVP